MTVRDIVLAVAIALCVCGCDGGEGRRGIEVTCNGDTVAVKVPGSWRYLLLPVEEACREVQVKLAEDDVWMDVRLAVDSVDYYVPFDLSRGRGTVPAEDIGEGEISGNEGARVLIAGLPEGAVAMESMKVADEWRAENVEYYRPLYHHTPSYGWMNDPNGMVYKDGEYHLYFQFNPYGSKWGNMHWGHAVSRDLIHWEELEPAVRRDTLGHIFSGNSVIDSGNTAGFGENAIVAVYTSHGERDGRQYEVQSLAYSLDDGRSFEKYVGNPVLTPFDGLKDFRDPKLFRDGDDWKMIVSADKEMRLYRSRDLKEWEFLSGFGEGMGAQPCQYECPDLFQLPIDGSTRYVMLMNINPGCQWGGSATEYFVGTFDGSGFKSMDDPHEAKWLDYGKDHYAAVTISNTGDRVIAIPWMSNWQYANEVPHKQFRGANALPRELSLYKKDGKYYVAADVVSEARALRQGSDTLGSAKGAAEFPGKGGDAFEIELDVTPAAATKAGIELSNDRGERLTIYFEDGRFVMDRTGSGLTNFSEHFPLATWAPTSLCEGGTYHVDIFVDKCSVEAFVDGGRIAMTNLVFPTEPYWDVSLICEGGEADFSGMTIYRLSL